MDYFSDHHGRTFCEGVSLTELADLYGTPLYVYSGKTIDRHCLALKQALSEVPSMPCFAVKANGNLSILKRIFSHGFGADVVSVGEMERALLAGAPPGHIVFSGVGKTDEEIRRALNVGILSFNVESLGELQRISVLAAEKKVKAPVSLRINPNIDAKTHPHIATGLYSTKFGIAESEMAEVLSVLKNHSSLDLVGLACHIGSQIVEANPFAEAARRMAGLAKTLVHEGFNLKYLDLGGGLGIKYQDETPPSLTTYAALIAEEIKDSGLKLLIEPGRVIVGNAGVLLTRVIGIKRTPKKTFVLVDAGMNDLIRPSLYDAYHDIVPVVASSQPKTMTDVVGPICETGDFLGLERELPLPKTDDLLFVKSAGAYGMSMVSHYNVRPNPAEVLVDEKHHRVIRKREVLSALWADELSALEV
jgi:diaminopimelate decarboxylase